jgi:CheY-like chemotaxis protein
LRQILLNLLSNAVKFTEAGEVVLSVSAKPSNGEEVELSFAVRDTGIGLSQQVMGRLFQSFSQADASTTRRYGGTGLGLAISKRLAELMGGRMWAESEGAGKGSTFYFNIRVPLAELQPASRRDSDRRAAGTERKARSRSGRQRDQSQGARTADRKVGHGAARHGVPEEALRWLRGGESFDLAILDMHMPEMDGTSSLGEFARHSRHAAGAVHVARSTRSGRRPFRRLARQADTSVAALRHTGQSAARDEAPKPSAAPVKPSMDPGMAARHPLRILLAEDNVVNQKLALRILQQMGYRADLASNGLEAVESVRRQTYDVVLMDVQMPEMDGLEASKRITTQWSAAERPRIVAMTANAMQGDRELCLARGWTTI